MYEIEPLLREIDRAKRLRGLRDHQVSHLLFNQGGFLARLRRGECTVRLDTARRAMETLRALCADSEHEVATPES